MPWIADDNPFLYIPSGKALRLGFGTGYFYEFAADSLYAAHADAAFKSVGSYASYVTLNGSDSWAPANAIYNVGATLGMSWQLSASGHADLYVYDGAAWKLRVRVPTTGGLVLPTIGDGLQLKEGSNATMGVATLVGGTVVVSTTKVTANSRIFLTVQSLGTVAVASGIAVTARTGGTSFTITASAPTDTSVIAWMIVEPAP